MRAGRQTTGHRERWWGRAAVAAACVVGLAGCGSSGTSSRAASTAPASTDATTTTPVGCTNDDVTAAVLSALAEADGRATAAELPGHTFYGNCGDDYFAVATMVPGPLATASQAAAFDGQAAHPRFFVSSGDENWKISAVAATAEGKVCDSFTAAPAALRDMWAGCSVGLHPDAPGPTSAGQDQQACLDETGSRTYVRIHSVQVAGDGSATLQANPVEVHCGGPDDLAYVDQPGTETLVLLAGAPIGVFDITANAEKGYSVSDLGAYLKHPELGVFEVYGAPPSLVTGIAEQFHP